MKWEKDTTHPLPSKVIFTTVKKQDSLWFPDTVCSIDLPGQYKCNIQTCKCSKAFYLGFFHPKGVVQMLQKKC